MLQSSGLCKLSAARLRATLALLALIAAAPAGAAGPFDAFYGTWSGSGNAIFTNGARESLMCKGYYSGEKSGLKLALRCASPSNRIDMRASLSGGDGSAITGTWEERTFNAEGSVSGKLNDNRLTAQLAGGISGTLTLSLARDTQLVSIDSHGTTFSGVKLKLKRR